MARKDLQFRQAKPKEKPYKLSDEKGLYLLVNPNGSKYWRMKYRFAGKEKVLALGVYDPKEKNRDKDSVSLSEAHELRDEARQVLRKGIDPGVKRKQARRDAKIKSTNTFEAIALEWFETQRGEWKPVHADRVLWSLRKYLFPDLGARPIADIEVEELSDLLGRIQEERGVYDTANRLLQRSKMIFRYAIKKKKAKFNPAQELTGSLKTRKVVHRTAMAKDELPAFLVKLDKYDGEPLTRLALLLLVHTFVRSAELRGARWDEFDINKQQWCVPAIRMKMEDDHIVPLSRQALAVLDEIKPYSGHRELLFPNRNRPMFPMSENTMLYAMYRMGYQSRATPHGFRANASTILHEDGNFKPDVIERQLAHAERNKVRGAYHRAQYMKDRIKMMQWWSDYLDSLRPGAKVVPISRRKVNNP